MFLFFCHLSGCAVSTTRVIYTSQGATLVVQVLILSHIHSLDEIIFGNGEFHLLAPPWGG